MLVEFEVDAALETAESVAGEDLLVCATYDAKRYRVEYLDERVFGGYGDTDEFYEVGDAVHESLFIDFLERRLLDDVHPEIGRIQASVTYFDRVALVRLLDRESGLFLAVEPEAPVSRLVAALRETMCETA